MFRRPELLVAGSVPVLLVAGVLPWHRDVVCTQSGCGPVAATAWTGSPVWALVLLVALALGGAWVLALPTRGRVPLAVAALTALSGVVGAALVVVSLDALVFNRAGFFGFDLPVTETFPVLTVHPGVGLPVGLLGLLLQAVGGWASVRRHTGLLSSPLSPPAHRHAVPTPAHHRTAAFAQGPRSAPPPHDPRTTAVGRGPAADPGAAAPDTPRTAAAFGQGPPPGRHGAPPAHDSWTAADVGQAPPAARHGAPPPRNSWTTAEVGQAPPAARHRRR